MYMKCVSLLYTANVKGVSFTMVYGLRDLLYLERSADWVQLRILEQVIPPGPVSPIHT